MTEAYESNHFLMKMQLQRIFETPLKEITKTPFRLFTISENTFVITVSLIKSDGIWFDTSWYDKDRMKINTKKHRMFGRDTHRFVEEVLNRLTISEIEEADDICLSKCKKSKVVDVEQKEALERKYKRISSKNNSMSTLIKPVTDADKRMSKAERTLFHDPKMWKFEECC